MENGQRAREYTRLKDRLALLGMATSPLVVGAVLFSGAAARLNARLLGAGDNPPARRLGYALALSTLSWLASLPLSFVTGHLVEHRYGLSRHPARGWAIDQIEIKAISTPVELAVVEGMYATIRRWPRRWWLVCAGAVIPLTAVFAQLFPVLVLPRFNRYEPLGDAALAGQLRALTERAGVPVADVLQMDLSRRTTKANAFFAGLGSTRRIVLADTLLDAFEPDEIEGVVAHEAAHQVHKDIWSGVAISSVFTLGMAWLADSLARRLLRRSPELVGTNDLAHPRSLPAIVFVLSIAGLFLTPLRLAWSRWIERRADRYALALTGNPRAYARAMAKLAETNLSDPDPPRGIVWLLHSHPPIAARIAAAEASAGSQAVG